MDKDHCTCLNFFTVSRIEEERLENLADYYSWRCKLCIYLALELSL